MVRIRWTLAALALSLGLWLLLGQDRAGALPSPEPPPSAATRPNILVVMTEDLGLRVGAFGDPLAVTPSLDGLAANGVRYPNTFTTTAVCGPSRAAHITGVHPITLGAHHMRSRDGGYLAVPPAEVKAYPELLRGTGYYTFTDFKLDYQFSREFAGTGPFTIWDDASRWASWRGRDPGQPFYGLVNLHSTHESALLPRSGWPRSFLHVAFQLLYFFEFFGEPELITPDQVTVPPYYPDTPTVRASLAQHYNNVHTMDRQFRELLNELEADGLADSTIIIWTSDHGDGLPRAKREIYDAGLQVPLIVYWPEAFRADGMKPGDVDDELISFVDLAPTVLSMAGVSAPAFMQGRAFAGSRVETQPRRYVYASKDRMDEVPDRQRAVRDHRFKYIRNYRPGEPGAKRLAFRDQLDVMRELWALHEAGELDGHAESWFEPRPKEALYDIEVDPHELHNLAHAPRHRATLERMRGALDEWLVRANDLGAIPEEELSERFWPGGVQPVTAAPVITHQSDENSGTEVALRSATEGASLAYRVRGETKSGDAWSLYAEPFALESEHWVEAKAVRYGWAESEVATLRLP